MERVAQTGIVEVTEQQLGGQQGINQIDDAEKADISAQAAGKRLGSALDGGYQHHQSAADEVDQPQGQKPGDILADDGLIKERYS